MTSIRHDYSVILRATTATPEILIITTPEGDTLPMCANPAHFWQSVEMVNNAIAEQYGLQVSVIRCLEAMIHNGEDQPLLDVYLHVFHGGNIAANMRWMPIDALPEICLPPIINNVQKWITEIQAVHPHRKSWYTLEGVNNLVQMVQARFDVSPQQVRSWERSTVWRIPTQQGNAYLKDVPPMFAFEAPLTQWLYQHFPENSTPTLNWDNPAQVLMSDYGGQALAPTMSLEIFESTLSAYAQLQIDVSKEVETLVKLGLPHRPVGWITEKIDAFFVDETNIKRGRFPISAEQVSTLQHALPHLKRACEVLSQSPIPDTLEHGDLWIGQIIIRENQPIFTDWSDSAITCPLFSLPYLLAEKSDLPDAPDTMARVTTAYLDTWQDFATRDTLDQLMPFVNLLSPLYSALRYHYDILPYYEHQWEMENMVSYNLRLLLKALDA